MHGYEVDVTGLLAPVQGGAAPGPRARAERRPSLNAHGLPCTSLKRAGPGGLRLRHL